MEKASVGGCPGDKQVTAYIETENPFNRLKRVYAKNHELADYYPEGKTITNVAYFTAATVGGVIFSLCGPRAKSNYVEANAVTVYDTRTAANRKAMDAFMLGGIKKGGKWLVITYLVVKPFLMLSLGLEMYRYKTSVANYAAGGAAVGAASRLWLGPSAMVAGAFLGTYAGVVSGFLITSALKFTSNTFEERYFREIEEKLLTKRFHEKQAEIALGQLSKSASKSPITKSTSPDEDDSGSEV